MLEFIVQNCFCHFATIKLLIGKQVPEDNRIDNVFILDYANIAQDEIHFIILHFQGNHLSLERSVNRILF